MTEKDTQKSVGEEMINEVQETEGAAQEENGRERHHHHHHHSKHSHHHKHHRRHHRRKNSSKKESKFTKFLKKNRSVIINVVSCTVSVALILIMAFSVDVTKPDKTENNHSEITQTTIKIETSLHPDKIQLVSNAVSQYLDPDNDATVNALYKAFSGHKVELNKGNPLNFMYCVTGLPTGVEVESAKLEISENENYGDAQVYQLDLSNAVFQVYNLKAGTKYYYRVSVVLSNNCVVGTTGRFETEKSVRILNIDGAENVRDIGGWVTEDGRTVRQGLLYRGSELDGAIQPDYLLTDTGLRQMIGELGIRFDMDLRSENENPSGIDALGKNVVHRYYGVGMYSELLTENYAEKLRQVFSDLANPDHYPIYLHCTYGEDRTGSICYLLEALLGMSKKDMFRDYELSAFTDSYASIPEFNGFMERINMLEGASTQAKVEGYLLSIGVTADEIASIRDIFLGE